MITDDYLNRSRVMQGLRAGLLGEHIHLYVEQLQQVGYCQTSVHRFLSVVRDFAFWLSASGHKPGDIGEALVTSYLAERSRHRPPRSEDVRALVGLIAVLRGAKLIASRKLARRDPREDVLEAYRLYMRRARGLAPASIESHLWFIRPFLKETGIATSADLSRLRRRDVTVYIERHAGDHSATTAAIMCSRLRVFLRYLCSEGLVPTDLTGAVPSIRCSQDAGLLTFMSADQVRRVIDRCDRSTAIGRRDYAILMLLVRLGLRAKEVATLTLDDIDWRAGQFTVHGKGRKSATMPLPPDVGAAIVSYLEHGRQRSNSRHLFLRARAPYVGFGSVAGVPSVARAALRRAGITGIAHYGSHVFRHSLATGLLRSGATLTEIGQLLRHEGQDTTRIYAKVDIDSLRALSLAWPGEAQ